MKAKKKNEKLTNYQEAQRDWDFRVNTAHKTLLAWRLIAVIALAMSGVSMLFAYSHITRPKMIPYVVRVNEESGRVDFAGMLANQQLEVTDAVVRHYLTRFLQGLRTVSTDVVRVQAGLRDTYWIATREAQAQITEMVREGDWLALAEDRQRRDIEIRVFERVSENSWRVEWQEHIRDRNGNMVDNRPMSGTFSFVTSMPESPVEAENNPYGLFFDAFHMNERRY